MVTYTIWFLPLLPKVLELFQTARPEPIWVFKFSSSISALARLVSPNAMARVSRTTDFHCSQR